MIFTGPMIFLSGAASFQGLVPYSVVLAPVAALCSIISGVRGLIYPSRYRARSIVGIIISSLALLGTFAVFAMVARAF